MINTVIHRIIKSARQIVEKLFSFILSRTRNYHITESYRKRMFSHIICNRPLAVIKERTCVFGRIIFKQNVDKTSLRLTNNFTTGNACEEFTLQNNLTNVRFNVALITLSYIQA